MLSSLLENTAAKMILVLILFSQYLCVQTSVKTSYFIEYFDVPTYLWKLLTYSFKSSKMLNTTFLLCIGF